MVDNRISFLENARGQILVGKTYLEFKKLAEEQIAKERNLTEDDLQDVLISLVITKLLVAEGKLEKKFFESAIS